MARFTKKKQRQIKRIKIMLATAGYIAFVLTAIIVDSKQVYADTVQEVSYLPAVKAVIVAPEKKIEPERIQDSAPESIAAELCNARGFDEWCADDLIAMAIAESGVQANVVGDNGLSHGYFQIQTKLHGVSKECTADFHCSADWTLSNLVKNGYPKYRTIAIRRHNGWGEQSKRYAANVKEIADSLAGR